MPTRRNGSALLTVLWLTVALSAVGLAVANNVRGETERTSTGMDDVKSYFIARGAIQRAALHMVWRNYADESGQPIYYRIGQPAFNLDFPDAQAVVDIIPETAKLNVNAIQPQDLLRLIMALGVPIDRATEITTAIIDWRTPVDALRTSPFDAFYIAQSPSFLPPHTSYKQDEELLLTKGVTPGLYYGESLDDSNAGLRDCLSVYGSNYSVDVNWAQPATLQAVGLSPEDAHTLAQQRAIHPVLDYTQLNTLQQELGNSGQRLTLGGHTMYTLRATVRLKKQNGQLSDLRRTVSALVQFAAKNQPVGYQIIHWYDRN